MAKRKNLVGCLVVLAVFVAGDTSFAWRRKTMEVLNIF